MRFWFYKWIISIAVVVSTFSCQLAYIVVDVEVPPPLPLPSDVTKIALNNRLTDSILTFNGDDFMLKGSNVKEISSIASLKVIKGIEEVIEKGDRFIIAGRALESTILDESGDLPSELSEQTISRICTDNKADVLLSLESLWYSSDIIYDSFLAKEPKDQNKIWSNTITYDVRRVEYFNALLTVKIKLGWRAYDPVNAKVIYEGYQEDSVFYEVQGRSNEEAEKKLPSMLNVVEKAGFIAGIKISEQLTPSLHTVERYYYKNGNKDFREAYQLVKFRRWNDAAEIWKPYLSSQHKTIKAMAYYNMALIEEIDGNIEQARKLINTATELYPKEEVYKYKRILDNR